jgi:NDP-4-keto-2,6-dideoxyhexose 3-C-methyltransferase
LSVLHAVCSCRACGSDDLVPVLDLGSVALTGTFPKAAAADPPRVPLELVKCRDWGERPGCGLVQLRHSVEPGLLYGENYGYRSGLNQWMVRHLEGLAERVARHVAPRDGDVALDIGSNDGTLLRALARPGLELVGMDPTAHKFAAFYPPGAHIVADFFSADRFLETTGGRQATIVTSVAMLYDLEQPLAFFEQVRRVLDDDGIWLVEQGYLPAMLANTAYDAVCHEHLEYYAFKQIDWLIRRAGMRIVDIAFNSSNGGSLSLIVAKRRRADDPEPAQKEEILAGERRLGLEGEAPFAEFRTRVFAHRDSLRALLEEARRERLRILGYGASTKGNVVLQFCRASAEELPCIADVNPDKFGCVTPGTRIPIVAESVARSRRPDAFLVLPWHLREAIVQREEAFLAQGGALVFALPEIATVPDGRLIRLAGPPARSIDRATT